MAYTVLARRYRSQAFGDVVGQGAIAETLKNAIRSGRVAHAYLFTGTRGVGKTSMARLFARALNAPDTVPDAPKPEGDEHTYPELEVQQRMADAIMRGDDLNVIELDGASNRGIDDARDIIAKAGLSPTDNARYKVYIIDEVHQLTKDAFNALLKIMEEPPSHVKFILATTEPHKIPATIHSRCQRFDFKNIPTAQIKQHLANVLKGESIEAEDEVLYQVAVLGNGSMRDALSLMDRLAASEERPLTGALLENMLGLPPRERVVALVDALADGDLAQTLAQTETLLASGIGQEQVIDVLIERLRQLMLISACGVDSELVELSPEARTKAAEQAKRFDPPGLVHMIALCEGLSRSSKSSSNPRALLDATMVRLALAEKMADVAALLAGGVSVAAEKKKLTGSPATSPPAPQTYRPPSRKQPASEGPAPVSAGSSSQAETAPDDASGSEAPSAVDLSDTKAVWQALHDRIASASSFAWVDKVQLVKLDTESGVCLLEPRSGQRDIAAFAGQRQRDRLALELTKLTSKRFRVELAEPARPNAGSQSDSPGSSQRLDRQKAMGLPLVRDVLDAFPDAVLIDTRKRES
ncbi:MAG: DNA polymerase III subunit gamma/tau [Phycisphaerales bacterium JB063]